ncbi:hypothetical protein [Lacrimispora sp. 210928-DFI.3.58]|uniref:hypothetical protein n=1 Tax=Lacrimispora sp. 210928-DFI.3.58 TaxID=2883214 RepID=UPI001D05D902|nr:hypothetical protein [Lacrimispora sp. 210928-DFI.3.58]MCB7321265.1 hypothetical protein [Lacrimispora sp. 210928-DFI.3.58]
MTFKESISRDAEKRKQNIQEYEEQIREISLYMEEMRARDIPDKQFLQEYMGDRREMLERLKDLALLTLEKDMRVLKAMEEISQG